jgi:hypothetical protein
MAWRVYRSLVGVLLVFIAARSVALWWQYDQSTGGARQGRELAHVLAEHLERTFGPIGSALNQLAVYSDRIGGPQAPREAWAPVMAATLSGPPGSGRSMSSMRRHHQAVDQSGRHGGVAPRWLPLPATEGRSERRFDRRACGAERHAGVTIPSVAHCVTSKGASSDCSRRPFSPTGCVAFVATIDVGRRGHPAHPSRRISAVPAAARRALGRRADCRPGDP